MFLAIIYSYHDYYFLKWYCEIMDISFDVFIPAPNGDENQPEAIFFIHSDIDENSIKGDLDNSIMYRCL